MSNALAIATVTTALAHVIRAAAQSAVPGAEVLTERPDSAPINQPRVRLFLYQVTPNTGMRNHDLPARTANGDLVQRPTAAIDLHYLLAFYGSESDLEPQRMLGAVVRDLHAKPVLMRQMIEDAVASEPFLTGSNLAEAPEQVKFTPTPVSLEEFSKLWSVFFQAPYVLSVAYQGSVLLIESDESVMPILPVLRRGEEDRGVDTVLGAFPTLESIHIGAAENADRRPRPPTYPGAELGSLLTLSGRYLGGDPISVRFTHTRLPITRTLPVLPEGRSATEIKIILPDDSAARTDWAAGLYTVGIVVTSGGSERLSNQLPLSLVPRILSIDPASPITPDATRQVEFTITCTPNIRPVQRASMLLADREIQAHAHAADTGALQFTVEDAPIVDGAVLRLRIDGIDSLPFRRQEMPPPPRLVFDDAQKVSIL